jgi:hypothetical protein
MPLGPSSGRVARYTLEMLALSPQFAEMWSCYEVEVRGPMLKHVERPQAGPLEFECQMLHAFIYLAAAAASR